MKSKTSLMKLPSFWVALLTPVVFATFVVVAMFLNGLPSSCWSYTCFNNAFEIFKVPLAILALIFPAVALVASHHRSVQTAAQIKVSEDKNAFENYFKHQEYFSESIENNKKTNSYCFEVFNSTDLYKKIFVDNSVDFFDPFYRGKGVFVELIKMLNDIEDDMCASVFYDLDSTHCYGKISNILYCLNVSKVEIYDDGEVYVIEDFHRLNSYKEYEIDLFLLLIKNYIIHFLSKIYSFSSNDNLSNRLGDRDRVPTGYINWSHETCKKYECIPSKDTL